MIDDIGKQEKNAPSNRIKIGDRFIRRFLLDEFSVETGNAGDDRCQNDKANSKTQPNLKPSEIYIVNLLRRKSLVNYHWLKRSDGR